MNFQSRITDAFEKENQRRREAGEPRLSKTDLWKEAELTSAAATHWFSGDNAADLDTCIKIAPLLRVRAQWLFDGSGPRALEAKETPPLRVAESKNIYNVSPVHRAPEPVPVISWIQAGDWCGVADPYLPGQAEDWVPCPSAHGPHTFALRVRGISMEPKFQDGAIIFVDPDRHADHLSNVVVRLENEEEATFKQLVIEGNKRFLRPLNPDWPEKLIEITSEATICGVVIGHYVAE